MSPRGQIAIFESLGGLFGWMWIGAGIAVLVLTVLAALGDWNWWNVLYAAIAAIVAKRLARGFYENQKRVAREIADRHLAEGEARIKIISDYGALMERSPSNPCEIRDVKWLPHGKDVILDAICLEIVRQRDDSLVESLKIGALRLADYQEGVGDRPIFQIGIDLSKASPPRTSGDVRELAREMAASEDPERFDAYRPVVEKDYANILAKLRAAEQVRRAMPDEQKRRVLG